MKHPTEKQYQQAVKAIKALAKKSNQKNPSLLRRFVNNEIVDELYSFAMTIDAIDQHSKAKQHDNR